MIKVSVLFWFQNNTVILLAEKPFIWVDYSIVTLLSVTLAIGTLRGFSREVLSLLNWVIGFWVSLHFCTELAPLLKLFISNTQKRLAVTFISLLVLTVLSCALIQYLLITRIKQNYNHTAFMERLGGFFCGIAQGIVMTTMMVFLANLTTIPHQNWWQESSLLPSFQTLATWLRDHVAGQTAVL